MKNHYQFNLNKKIQLYSIIFIFVALLVFSAIIVFLPIVKIDGEMLSRSDKISDTIPVIYIDTEKDNFSNYGLITDKYNKFKTVKSNYSLILPVYTVLYQNSDTRRVYFSIVTVERVELVGWKLKSTKIGFIDGKSFDEIVKLASETNIYLNNPYPASTTFFNYE